MTLVPGAEGGSVASHGSVRMGQFGAAVDVVANAVDACSEDLWLEPA